MHLPLVRRRILQGLWLLLVWSCLAWASAPVLAQGVELVTLRTSRDDGALSLEFAARLTLNRTVEDALQHGVPVYFVAQAELKRSRWYWRDERIARVSRQWRLAYQPLTGTWRVGLAGINQTYPTLGEALVAISRSAGWRLADLAQVDGDSRHYIDFSYRLDTSQLPGPMQFGLAGQGDWALGVERTLRLD
jgi:hypothetical protein